MESLQSASTLLVYCWSLCLFVLTVTTTPADASVACNSTTTCEKLLRPGSECIDGFCSNPFVAGCLQNYLGPEMFPHRRICSSHDGFYGNTNSAGERVEDYFDPNEANCDLPAIDYNELRVLYQDWDSGIMTSWVLQILLSEVVRVPISMEGSDGSVVSNFYDPQNRFHYGSQSYDYDAMRRAKDEEDCREIIQKNAENGGEGYVSCAHVMPEAWSGQRAAWIQHEKDGLIEPAEGTGGVAKYSWYIPRFTALMDHTLLSHFGLRGPEGRRKLAETFKRPTTWKQYCEEVSLNHCSGSSNNLTDATGAILLNNTEMMLDPVAVRPPETEGEGQQYFVPGLFTGHFRATEKNDCDKNPDTCTGHIANVVCSWSTYVIPQAYHNDIAVESNGPELNGGYPFLRMLEIYQAANHTKSPVIFYWFTPDPMLQSFLGTDAEMQQILLPTPTQECVDSRVTEVERCSETGEILDQVGEPQGGCDSVSHSYQKLIVSNLFSLTDDQPEPEQSPAYAAVKRFRISDLQIATIFDSWYDRDIDRWGYDPRHAVCRWVAENLDDLQRFVPRTYPREAKDTTGYSVDTLHLTAMVVASFCCIMTVVTAVTVFVNREKTVMQYAQVEFVLLVIAGLFLVSLGALFGALEPTTVSCVGTLWFILLGYTLEMVPLVVKVGAIHTLMSNARQMRRVKLKRWHLFRTVIFVVMFVIVYLLCQTFIDRPMPQQEILLPGTTTTSGKADNNSDDEKDGDGYSHDPLTFFTLEINHYCSPDREFWIYIQMGWQVFMLLMAMVLAIQTRNVISEFNESRRLGIMVYSHFVFLVLRIIIVALEGTVALSRLQGFQSLAISGDTFSTLIIYFFPMFYDVITNKRPNFRESHRTSLTGFPSERMPRNWMHPTELARNLMDKVSATSGAVADAVVRSAIDRSSHHLDNDGSSSSGECENESSDFIVDAGHSSAVFAAGGVKALPAVKEQSASDDTRMTSDDTKMTTPSGEPDSHLA